jgi:hypothetical protein
MEMCDATVAQGRRVTDEEELTNSCKSKDVLMKPDGLRKGRGYKWLHGK